MILVEVDNAILEFLTALRFVDGQVEQVHIGIERKLVHRIYGTHVIENEEQYGGSFRTQPITL